MRIVLYLSFIFISIYIFEYEGLDFYIQDFLYNFSDKSWVLEKNTDLIYKYIFYNFAKYLVILIAVYFLYIFIYSFFRKKYLHLRKKALIIILAIGITPAFVGYLKKSTNIPCPNQLRVYDGNKTYRKVFDKSEDIKIGRCFPAGHASGGLALIILSILGRTKKEKIVILFTTISFGLIIGFYKMLIGDHFTSHTLISLLIAFIIKDILLNLFKEKNENFNN